MWLLLKVFNEERNWIFPPGVPNGRSRDALESVLGDVDVPTTSLEDWRYGEIDGLDLDSIKYVNSVGELSEGLLNSLVDDYEKKYAGSIENLAVMVNGDRRIVTGFDGPECSIQNVVHEAADRALASGTEPFRVLPYLATDSSAQIVIGDPDKAVSAALGLFYESRGSSLQTTALKVRVPDNCHATLLVTRDGGQDHDLIVSDFSVEVGRDATFQLCVLQNLNEPVWDLSHLRSVVKENGQFSLLSVALGGSYSRVMTVCDLVGRSASAKLNAAYLAGSTQTMEFRTFQNHKARDTRSDLLYKGAVSGAAHSIYSGLIRIDKGARGSNAFQTNRNIVLSENARADSVPNLDIQENDVKCSHASAVGPVDAEQRFYLESKGIDSEEAEKMIVRGFFRDLMSEFSSFQVADVVGDVLEKMWG